MIRHVWSVLCGKSVIDRDTNNISLFEVTERIQLIIGGIGALPQGAPINLELITLWARLEPNTPADCQMRVRLLAPDGHELSTFPPSRINLTTASRVRQRIRIQGILLDGTGWYDWEVAYRLTDGGEWIVATRVPLEIVLVQRANEPPGDIRPAATTDPE